MRPHTGAASNAQDRQPPKQTRRRVPPTDLDGGRPAEVTREGRGTATRVFWALGAVTALLILAHFSVTYAKYVLGHDHLRGLERMFNVLKEANVPTWFSSACLLASAALLAGIARAKRAARDLFAWRWFVLAAVFLYLSMDESAMVHETVQDQLRQGLDRSDPLYSLGSIVFPALLASLVLLFSLRLLASLPHRTAFLFVAAGAIFVTGAIGVDYVGELHKNAYGDDNLVYGLWNGVEELFEMAGVVLLIYALLDYIETHDLRTAFALPSHTAE